MRRGLAVRHSGTLQRKLDVSAKSGCEIYMQNVQCVWAVQNMFLFVLGGVLGKTIQAKIHVYRYADLLSDVIVHIYMFLHSFFFNGEKMFSWQNGREGGHCVRFGFA